MPKAQPTGIGKEFSGCAGVSPVDLSAVVIDADGLVTLVESDGCCTVIELAGNVDTEADALLGQFLGQRVALVPLDAAENTRVYCNPRQVAVAGAGTDPVSGAHSYLVNGVALPLTPRGWGELRQALQGGGGRKHDHRARRLDLTPLFSLPS